MQKFGGRHALITSITVLVISGAFLILPTFLRSSYSSNLLVGEAATSTISLKPIVRHLPTPEPLKALYMTACVAGTPSWREFLKDLITETELNAVVIDIKDATGTIVFRDEELQDSTLVKHGCKITDLREFIESLHERDIYVIGRISVFQDPYYTALHPELAVKSKSTGDVWKDNKKLSFIDAGAHPYWEYIIDISKKSYELGFDELNYDYIRYPSDGPMSDTEYTWAVGTTTKEVMIESFFKYLYDDLETYRLRNLKTSADLFGMTTTVENDMNIGQVLERALPYFDYISPMVYPSHYPKTWNGFANPAEHPYEVVKIAMTRAVEREQAWLLSNNLATSTPSKMRPWLQDFDLGATYDAPQVRAQIQATYDSGLTSWMLWSAGNKYTKEALLKDI